MSEITLEYTSRLKELDEAIKTSRDDVVKKKAAVKRAKANLSKAENETYRLRCMRDQFYLGSLGDKVDWGMVFNYNEDETDVAASYRKLIAQNYELSHSGHYNPETMQYVFCVEFKSDSKQELYEKTKTLELVFSNLVPNTKDENRKSILIYNLIDVDDFDTYELAHNPMSENYCILVRRLGGVRQHQEFNSLDAALSFIQSRSKVAFDALSDQNLITVNT